MALSDKPGVMPLFDGNGNTRNESGNTHGGLLTVGDKVGEVDVSTIDIFVAEKGIAVLDFVKIDVEGFELEVFRGMETSVKSGKLRLFTFEYGNKWRSPRPGHPHGNAFKPALDMLDGWGFDTFVVGTVCWVQLNGGHYSTYFENVKW